MQKRQREQDTYQEPKLTTKFVKSSKDSESTIEEREDHPGDLKKFIKDERVISVLNKIGVKELFPIQYKTFKIVFQGKDIKGKDKTGSGKTLAFSLPIIQRFRKEQLFKSNKNTKFLVILPTRQLVLQVVSNIGSLRLAEGQFSVVGVYGGEKPYIQLQKLKRGADIVIATPGRLIDMIEKGKMDFSKLKAICLDQADQMLKMGFQKDIETIFQFINKSNSSKPQTLLFSATFPPWVSDISKNYQSKECELIDLVGNSNIESPTTIEHVSIRMDFQGQYRKLIPLLMKKMTSAKGKTIIFCETKLKVNSLCEELQRKDIDMLHGDVPQDKREQIYNNFKTGKINIIVATNVAARGLDFPEIELVIQTEPPKEIESYIHRAGRTGRAGKKGKAVMLYTSKQQMKLKQIERMSKIEFTQMNKREFE